MLTTSDFKRGLAIQVEGQPYIIMEYTVQTPSARGSATLVRIKGRNVITGHVLDMTFKSGEKFEEPDLERRKITFMYADGDAFHFMDEESFEQFHLDRSMMQDTVRWLREGVTLRSIVFGEMSNVVDLFAVYSYFGAFSIGSFWYRLYQYGHNLDPHAPMHIKPFTPRLIGVEQIANFREHSYPQAGAYLLCVSVLLIVLAGWFSRKETFA